MVVTHLPQIKAGEYKLYEWLLDYQKLVDEIDYIEYKLDRSERELKRWNFGDLQNVKMVEGAIAARWSVNLLTK